VKEAISKGVSNRIFAYVSKSEDGEYDPVYYDVSLTSEEVELSEEWFIVKEPKRPELHEIIVYPDQISIPLGEEVAFSAKGLSKQGLEAKIDALNWTATGGTIDEFGVFKAGANEGVFSVNAIAGEVKGSAFVTILAVGAVRTLEGVIVSPQDCHIGPGKKQAFTAKGLDKDGLEVPLVNIEWSATGGTIDGKGVFQAGQEEGSFKVTAIAGDANGSASLKIGRLSPHWNGEIPHQKWTQFYNRILSKFAVRKGLKLTVSVDILDASLEEIEDMRTALRELGLIDNVTF